MDVPAVAISGLTKYYQTGFLHRRRTAALVDLNLTVRTGEIFGYLGPNGSGKTTTLKVILGLVRASAGTVSVLSCRHSDPSWRYRVGYLPENPYFYDYLTAREYLDYVGRLFGQPLSTRRTRAQQLLEMVGLHKSPDQALRYFSKGMIQRVGIAQALMNDPELVFLDEPMSGLDPMGRRLVREIIFGLKKAAKTVVFSTHILSDAEVLCDRVGLLRGGRLLQEGRLDEILTLDVAHMEVLVSGLDALAIDALGSGVRNRQCMGERWRLDVEEPWVGRVIRAVEEAHGRVISLNPVRQSLEDYFFREVSQSGSEASWTPEE